MKKVAGKKITGPYIVLGWALINLCVMLVQFAFFSDRERFSLPIYAGGVALLLVTAVCVAATGERQVRDGGARGARRSGAAGLALAGAALMGGFAWTFGLWVAYFALPLFVFALSRLWGENRGRAA